MPSSFARLTKFMLTEGVPCLIGIGAGVSVDAVMDASHINDQQYGPIWISTFLASLSAVLTKTRFQYMANHCFPSYGHARWAYNTSISTKIFKYTLTEVVPIVTGLGAGVAVDAAIASANINDQQYGPIWASTGAASLFAVLTKTRAQRLAQKLFPTDNQDVIDAVAVGEKTPLSARLPPGYS